jgi:hypothetical protein
MAPIGNHGGKGMWPSSETATWLYDWANIFLIGPLVVGAVATVLIVWMGNVKEEYLRRDLSATNARAVEAELALAKFRAPRLPTSEELASLTEKLKPFKGIVFDTGLAMDDREQQDFLWRLEPALWDAGWKEVDWLGSDIPLRRGDRPISGRASVLNVSIEIHPESRDKFLSAAKALKWTPGVGPLGPVS